MTSIVPRTCPKSPPRSRHRRPYRLSRKISPLKLNAQDDEENENWYELGDCRNRVQHRSLFDAAQNQEMKGPQDGRRDDDGLYRIAISKDGKNSAKRST